MKPVALPVEIWKDIVGHLSSIDLVGWEERAKVLRTLCLVNTVFREAAECILYAYPVLGHTVTITAFIASYCRLLLRTGKQVMVRSITTTEQNLQSSDVTRLLKLFEHSLEHFCAAFYSEDSSSRDILFDPGFTRAQGLRSLKISHTQVNRRTLGEALVAGAPETFFPFLSYIGITSTPGTLSRLLTPDLPSLTCLDVGNEYEKDTFFLLVSTLSKQLVGLRLTWKGQNFDWSNFPSLSVLDLRTGGDIAIAPLTSSILPQLQKPLHSLILSSPLPRRNTLEIFYENMRSCLGPKLHLYYDFEGGAIGQLDSVFIGEDNQRIEREAAQLAIMMEWEVKRYIGGRFDSLSSSRLFWDEVRDYGSDRS